MKTKYTLFTVLLAGITSLTSCVDDFLDQKNTTNLNQETFFASDAAVAAATAPLYNYVWNNFNEKFYYAMGDGRANNITAQYSAYIHPYTNFAESSISEGLDGAWNSLYSVVAQSNNTIYNIQNFATKGVSESAKASAIAEARFMRGTAYWYIASLWGAGIIYTNTSDLVNNYVVPAQPCADVIEFAIRDLEFAAKYLPSTQADPGRVTRYSAYGMLSRMYLSMAGITSEGEYDGSNVATNPNRGSRNSYYLELARKAALKVVNEYSGKLLKSYGALFDVATIDNNEESLFQLQWLEGTSEAIGGCAQNLVVFYGWSTMVTDATNWGGATYCSWNLWQEFCNYKDETLGQNNVDDKVRRHYSVASYGEFYPDMNKKNGGYTYGITENSGDQGANIKKYVIGTNADNGISYKGSAGINTYMMRLAEVYLNLAEAILGNASNTTDETALKYFNLVRERAEMPIKEKLTYEDIRHERRMEFAFEGLYWYDLIRRSYYQQQEVLDYINNQQRNANYEYNKENSTYEIDPDYTEPGTGVSVATVRNLTLPVSATDQSKNPLLKPNADGTLNTAPYTFGSREVNVTELFN